MTASPSVDISTHASPPCVICFVASLTIIRLNSIELTFYWHGTIR